MLLFTSGGLGLDLGEFGLVYITAVGNGPFWRVSATWSVSLLPRRVPAAAGPVPPATP